MIPIAHIPKEWLKDNSTDKEKAWVELFIKVVTQLKCDIEAITPGH